MRVLFDIVHPAHVLFFRRAVETLQAAGAEVLILSRRKDIACDLLDRFDLAHEPISSAASGLVGLASELAIRDGRLFTRARRFRPDVMIGFGGVAISHVGRIIGVPSVSFYDTEAATIQNRMTWPFITRLYVPECYEGPTPAGRTSRVPGVKALAFLHPDEFQPARDVALAAGLDPARANYFLRLVSWRANHDLGKTGWTADDLAAAVDRLAPRGRVHISSEVDLPAAFEAFRYRGAPEAVHHFLGHCDLYVGESATMASEAAILGVRSLHAGRDEFGYVKELCAHGLMTFAPPSPERPLVASIDKALAVSGNEVQARRDAYCRARPDWTPTILKAIADAAASGGRAHINNLVA